MNQIFKNVLISLLVIIVIMFLYRIYKYVFTNTFPQYVYFIIHSHDQVGVQVDQSREHSILNNINKLRNFDIKSFMFNFDSKIIMDNGDILTYYGTNPPTSVPNGCKVLTITPTLNNKPTSARKATKDTIIITLPENLSKIYTTTTTQKCLSYDGNIGFIYVGPGGSIPTLGTNDYLYEIYNNDSISTIPSDIYDNYITLTPTQSANGVSIPVNTSSINPLSFPNTKLNIIITCDNSTIIESTNIFKSTLQNSTISGSQQIFISDAKPTNALIKYGYMMINIDLSNSDLQSSTLNSFTVKPNTVVVVFTNESASNLYGNIISSANTGTMDNVQFILYFPGDVILQTQNCVAIIINTPTTGLIDSFTINNFTTPSILLTTYGYIQYSNVNFDLLKGVEVHSLMIASDPTNFTNLLLFNTDGTLAINSGDYTIIVSNTGTIPSTGLLSDWTDEALGYGIGFYGNLSVPISTDYYTIKCPYTDNIFSRTPGFIPNASTGFFADKYYIYIIDDSSMLQIYNVAKNASLTDPKNIPTSYTFYPYTLAGTTQSSNVAPTNSNGSLNTLVTDNGATNVVANTAIPHMSSLVISIFDTNIYMPSSANIPYSFTPKGQSLYSGTTMHAMDIKLLSNVYCSKLNNTSWLMYLPINCPFIPIAGYYIKIPILISNITMSSTN